MEVPWRREPLKEEGMEGWGVAQRMGALEGEGSWKAEGDPRRWRGPLSGANLSLEGGGDPGGRRGPWRAKGIPGECLESGGDPREQRGTLEGGGGPWVVQISAWREEGAPEGGEGPGGQRGSLEGRGPGPECGWGSTEG